MNAKGLREKAVKELLTAYITIGAAQDEALLYEDTDKFNRLYEEKVRIESELKARKGDQRRALASLYDHPNMQVRLNAAYATLVVEPRAAQNALVAIAGSKHLPQAGAAGMSLRFLADGIFKPT